MPNSRGHQEYTFVLWADRFDETAATIFLTELRKAGLRTKLLSLARQKVAGAYGLALVPDLTLEQAMCLVTQVRCLVIPSGPGEISRLANDPRMTEVLARAHANNALIVVGGETQPSGQTVSWLLPADVLTYPGDRTVLDFARILAEHLVDGQNPNMHSQPRPALPRNGAPL